MKRVFACVCLFVIFCSSCLGRHVPNRVIPEEICTGGCDIAFLYAGDYRGGYDDRAYACEPHFIYDIEPGDLLIIYNYEERGNSRLDGKAYSQPVFQCEYNEEKGMYGWKPYSDDICGVSIDSIIDTFGSPGYDGIEIIKPYDQCNMAKTVLKRTGKNNRDEKYGVVCDNDTLGKEIFYVGNHVATADESFYVCTVNGWENLNRGAYFSVCEDFNSKPRSGWVDIGVYRSFYTGSISHIYTTTKPISKNVYEYDLDSFCARCPDAVSSDFDFSKGCQGDDKILNCNAMGKVWDVENNICTDKNISTIDSEELSKEVKDAKKVVADFFESAQGDKNVWKNAEGKFNTARLASDMTAGVVLGTVGGVVSGVVIKKKQVQKGFEALHCTVGGQKVADWGDTFWVGLSTE